MDKQERLAREWAEKAKEAAPRMAYTPESVAAYEFILANTKPLTMADVEWDDEKHHLAGATAPNGCEVVMFWPEDDYISTDQESWSRDCLTPNGKRYELREVGAGEPDVRRARALIEELARDHNLHSLTDGKLARTMNEVLDALATTTPIEDVEDTDEADEAKRPVVLETLESYKDAPDGTIIATVHGAPWVKELGDWWVGDRPVTSESIAYQPRIVLRWGWGK